MPELSAAEQQTLDIYIELADLKAKDEAAFNAKMDAAKQYVVQAGYFPQEYFELQAANKTTVEQEKKLREAGVQLVYRRPWCYSAAEERRWL